MRHGFFATKDSVCKRIFFFQAEDGIRDLTVTGVQTCALPICCLWKMRRWAVFTYIGFVALNQAVMLAMCLECFRVADPWHRHCHWIHALIQDEIGRASCRERV